MEFYGFSLDAWITILTVLTMFTVLLTTKLRADLVFLGAIGVLLVSGVLDQKEAFAGFSSGSVVVIGVLFVVVAGLTHTGVLQWIVKNLLGQPKSFTKAIIRLMVPVAVLSSFLSNTTVVALFVNIVKMWSKKLNISPSKLLIPLSYASGMGGVCTLIGTPPNLIISGLYSEHTGTTINVLATTIPGLFCLFIGVLSFIAMPCMLGFSGIATELITLTITDKWADCARLMQIVCIGGAFIPLHNLMYNLNLSWGRSDVCLWCTLAFGLVQLLSITVCRTRGIEVMVWVFTVVNVFWALPWWYLVRRLIGLTLREFLADVLPYTVIAGLSVLVACQVASLADGLMVVLAVKIVVAAILYFAILWLTGARTLRESIELLPLLVRKRRS